MYALTGLVLNVQETKLRVKLQLDENQWTCWLQKGVEMDWFDIVCYLYVECYSFIKGV